MNIHQFFPVLDHTFNKPFVGTGNPRSEKQELIVIEEEESTSEQTEQKSFAIESEVSDLLL